MTDKEWDEFLEWLYNNHQISRTSWSPNKVSIELYLEYKEATK